MSNLIKNPYGKYIGNERKYVMQVLDSENLENKINPFTRRLEKSFAQRFNKQFAIALNSGTSTLHACLAAAGVGAGDEVISPAQSVAMNSFVTLHQNAIPVYADLDPETFNVDPADVERKITPRTRAIFAVHMHGLPVDINAIMDIAKKHDIAVIEDSAQCLLGECNGRLAGTQGHMASFSFETKKHLSTGEGGIIVTDDEFLAEKARKTGFNGYKTLKAGAGLSQLLPEEFQDPNFKRHDTLGWNYRMNEITAAVALAQLERIDSIVEKRREVARLFHESLEECDWIIPQKIPEGSKHSYYSFTVRYEGQEAYCVSWKDFYRLFKGNGGDGFYGGTAISYFEPVIANKEFCNGYLPDIDLYRNAFNYEKGLCPIAEELQPKIMSFKTNYRNLEDAQAQAKILKETIDSIQG